MEVFYLSGVLWDKSWQLMKSALAFSKLGICYGCGLDYLAKLLLSTNKL